MRLPLTTDSGCVETGLRRASASSSRRLTRIQRFPLDALERPAAAQLLALEPERQVAGLQRLLDGPVAERAVAAAIPDDHRAGAVLGVGDDPLEFAPCRSGDRRPPSQGASRGVCGRPRGTAHDLRTPPASSRKSQCIERASCCWITKRATLAATSALQRCDLQRALVAGFHLKRRVCDPEALPSSSASWRRCACVSQPERTVTCATAPGSRGDLPDMQVVHLDHVVLGREHVPISSGSRSRGAASSSTRPDSRSRPTPEYSISPATSSAAMPSARPKSVSRMIATATAVAMNANRSFRTCWKALHVEAAAVRAGQYERSHEVHADSHDGDDQHGGPSTSGGSMSRRMPSTPISAPRPTSVAPFSWAEDLGAPVAEREAALGRPPRRAAPRTGPTRSHRRR